jgi:hypothetical protein
MQQFEILDETPQQLEYDQSPSKEVAADYKD